MVTVLKMQLFLKAKTISKNFLKAYLKKTHPKGINCKIPKGLGYKAVSC